MSSYTVTVQCGGGNDFTSQNLGARISSVFVIGVGSMAGMLAYS